MYSLLYYCICGYCWQILTNAMKKSTRVRSAVRMLSDHSDAYVRLVIKYPLMGATVKVRDNYAEVSNLKTKHQFNPLILID